MYQTAILEKSKIETASVRRTQTFVELQLEEAKEPQNAFLSASVAERAMDYAEAATFVLFMVLIITAASLTAYGVMQVAQSLAELNYNQSFWVLIASEI